MLTDWGLGGVQGRQSESPLAAEVKVQSLNISLNRGTGPHLGMGGMLQRGAISLPGSHEGNIWTDR